MERRGRNARAPVGETEFDDSGDEDQDIGEFEPGGAGAPEGYHYMDDGTLMSDAAHLTGEGYIGAPESYHLMADDMRGNGLTLFATH